MAKYFYGAVSGAGKPKNGIFILAGLTVLVFIGIQLGQEVWREYQTKKEIEAMKNDISKYDRENNDLEKMLEYYKTLSYKEKEARLKLNLQKPGEKVIIVDQGDFDSAGVKTGDAAVAPEKSMSALLNAQKWWNYFFGQK